jgi:drug/metabolite transporter (DMT)-like permease
MIIMVALCWGSSCLVTKFALDDLQEFNLTVVRFLAAFVLSFIVFFKKLKIDKKVVGYAAALSANYFIVMAFMTFGVQYTSVSKAGFLTCIAGVFVPLINVLVLKKKIGKKTALCAAATFAGVYILSMGGVNEHFGINIGDILCTLCSLFFAIHIILIGVIVKRIDIITFTVLQMGFVSLYSLFASLLLETPRLPATIESWFSVLWLGIICSVVAMLLQNIAQKHTTDTRAGIIFTLEPVFAVILAYASLGETLTLAGYIGAAAIIVSIIILEIDFELIRKI